MAFGVLVSQSSIPWWWAPVFATVIFAGSLEFLVFGLVTVAAPLATIAATAFLVNFRHVFYALSFPLHRVRGRCARAYSTFALTDEAWAMTSGPEAATWSGRRILWLQGTFHAGWVLSVTIGALAGALIPTSIPGLDFALTSFFLVLAMEAFRVRREIPGPVVALLCALLAQLVAGDGVLLVAMGLFVAYLLVRYFWSRRSRIA